VDFFAVKYLLKNLFLPPAGPLILAICGLAAANLTRLRRSGTALCALGLLSLWLLATPRVADILERAAERDAVLDLNAVPPAGAVVILAGGVRGSETEYPGPTPSLTTLQRLTYGAHVARVTGLPILVSGSAEEAAAMSDSLQRDFGLQVRWIEGRSRDTHENALFSGVILRQAGISNIVLVTSGTHMPRANAEFRAAGFTVIPAPSGMWSNERPEWRGWVPQPEALWRSQGALYEDLGNLVLALRGAH
jgi:uncharacterized SAM-binding protein YcdF (DUF218 family)